jgi:subtilisin family serine protease
MTAGDDIGFGLKTAEFPKGMSTTQAKAAAAALVRSGKVISAEPDLPMSLSAVQNPVPSWGLDRLDQRALPLASGYSYAQDGTGVTAYILDTGIRASHTDFGKRVRKGYDAIPADNQNTNDCNGHGTHVAGTVGGTTYGVAKNVSLVAVRALGCDGSGYTSGIISALAWIVTDHLAGVPAVVNMSIGGGKSDALNAAVESVIADGVVAVVASGNNDVDACNVSPASAPNAITVNATGDYTKGGTAAGTDARAIFSNWGACTDIYAPGSNIISDWYTSDTATNTESGTSMATPHVAGVVARMLQAQPTLTPAQVWTAMSAAATTLSASTLLNANGTAVTYTGGATISGDTTKFVYIAGTAAPGAPTSVTTKTSSGTVTATWVTPGSAGSSAITGYTATAYSALTDGSSVGSCTAVKLTCAITGLMGGVSVYVSVTANNADGTSAASSPRVAQALAATAPGQPTSVSATRGASGAVAVTWTAPSATGGSAVTGYTAYAYTTATGGTSGGSCTAGSSATTCTITGLIGGSTYYVGVKASNAIGAGAASTPLASIVAYSLPGASAKPTAVAGSGKATVTWTAPASNGGQSITAYTAKAWSAATGGTLVRSCTWSTGTLTCDITGLTKGVSYYIDVTATNSLGAGVASARTSAVKPT